MSLVRSTQTAYNRIYRVCDHPLFGVIWKNQKLSLLKNLAIIHFDHKNKS